MLTERFHHCIHYFLKYGTFIASFFHIFMNFLHSWSWASWCSSIILLTSMISSLNSLLVLPASMLGFWIGLFLVVLPDNNFVMPLNTCPAVCHLQSSLILTLENLIILHLKTPQWTIKCKIYSIIASKIMPIDDPLLNLNSLNSMWPLFNNFNSNFTTKTWLKSL